MPTHLREKLRVIYKIDGNAVTIYEERPYFQDPARLTHTSVARLRYHIGKRLWTLYWADRNSNWHLYEEHRPTKSVQTLLDEVTRDPTHIFWG